MKKYNVLIGACLLLSVTTTWAGNSGIGGGDLCEDRIKVVRDDINDWIVKGGPKELVLPNGITAEQYSLSMLKALAETKDIKCVSKGDQGFPVAVNGTPKVCIFDQTGGSITCDFVKFNSMNESDQYVLIHHEYAGLASIEKPDGASSDYQVSNQISGYLINQVVKRLSITAASSTTLSPVVVMYDRYNQEVSVPFMSFAVMDKMGANKSYPAFQSKGHSEMFCKKPELSVKIECTDEANDPEFPHQLDYSVVFDVGMMEYGNKIYFGTANMYGFWPTGALEKSEFLQKVANASQVTRQRIDLFMANLVALRESASQNPNGFLAGYEANRGVWDTQIERLFSNVFFLSNDLNPNPTLAPGFVIPTWHLQNTTSRFSAEILSAFKGFDWQEFYQKYAGYIQQRPLATVAVGAAILDIMQFQEFIDLFNEIPIYLPGSTEYNERLTTLRDIARKHNYDFVNSHQNLTDIYNIKLLKNLNDQQKLWPLVIK